MFVFPVISLGFMAWLGWLIYQDVKAVNGNDWRDYVHSALFGVGVFASTVSAIKALV